MRVDLRSLAGSSPVSIVTTVLLVLALVIGLAVKLVQSYTFDLSSDSAEPGLIAMDIWKHGNYFLHQYYLPSSDPYTFTDILPFHLIPQVLSGYDPTVLRMTGFVIFCLAIFVFAYYIYRITDNRINALIFLALAAVISPLAYHYFAELVAHVATIFFIGALLLLAIGLEKADNYRLAFILALANLIAFSDTIVLAWFTVPFAVACFVFYRARSRRAIVFAGLVLFTSLVTVAYKTLFIDYLVPYPFSPGGFGNLAGNLVLFASGTITMMLGGVDVVFPTVPGLQVLDLVMLLVICMLGALAVRNILKSRNEKLRFFFVFLLVSAIIMVCGYVFTSFAGTDRYLIFTAMSVLMLLSFSYGKEWYVPAIIGVLLLYGVLLNLAVLGAVDWSPNEAQYGVIDFMESENITYAYGNYWDANVITYLSGEAVTVRPVDFDDGALIPHEWLTGVHWYDARLPEYYLLVNGDDPSTVNDSKVFLQSHLPDSELRYRNYTFYHFNGTGDNLYEEWVFDRGSGFERLKNKLS